MQPHKIPLKPRYHLPKSYSEGRLLGLNYRAHAIQVRRPNKLAARTITQQAETTTESNTR